MWVYDLDLWLWRSPRLSARVPSANFGDYSFSIYGLLEQHSSDWSRDLATLTFDLRGHGACGWCRSSSSIQVLSSYALPFGRYGAWCVSALMGLVTLTFDLLTLKLVCESHLRWGTFFFQICDRAAVLETGPLPPQDKVWNSLPPNLIRPVQAVTEDIFIRTVRPRRSVSCF